MARRRNTHKTLQKHQDDDIDPEIILPVPGSARLINARIIQVLVEKDTPEEVERLMQLDLDYN